MTRIFISHSHSDEAIAFRLVNFLLAALRIEEEVILYTSNPDQGLSYSSNSITDQLKNRLKISEAILILITADSLHSAWIPFEAGSFWTTDKPIIPILDPGLNQNNLPGPLRNFLSIAISQSDFADKLNSAINQLASKLQIEERFPTCRNHTLQEFAQKLTNWTSKYPNSKAAAQQVAELTKQLEELQISHSQQLEEIKTASLQEKEQIEQSYQGQIIKLQQINQEQQEQKQSLKSQIKQLKEELQQAQSSLLHQQLTEQSLQARIQELEQLQPTNLVSVPKIVSETEEVELRSERGVDYTKLRDLLKQQQWQAADQETARVMLQAANRKNSYRKNSYLRREDIDNFSCEDLRTINDLWLYYSDGKFGFSVQREIYESLGGTTDYDCNI